jgi:hypothetical protein
MTRASRRTVLVSAGLLALALGLVVSFPARLALSWFAPPQVHAWGVDGTIWRGSAAEVALPDGSLGALAWRARPAGLLIGRPAWDIDLRRPDGRANARVSFSLFSDRQRVTNLEATLALGTLPPSVVPAGVAGQLEASLERLELHQGWPTAIVGRALVADLDLPGVILTLGPFRFEFSEQAGEPVAAITATDGPLLVDGRMELPARGLWRFSAVLEPGPDAPRELIDGLGFVGEDLGGGRRQLTLSSEP